MLCATVAWLTTNFCHSTELATEVVSRVSSSDSSSDPDTVLSELEHALVMIDSVPTLTQGHCQLAALHCCLVNLYEHWTFIHCSLPPCTFAAVGVEGGKESHVQSRRQRGQPPIFLNLDMVVEVEEE